MIPNMKLLEVCVDSFESGIKAEKSGAHRLEICQDLSVGGITPTAGFIKVMKNLVSIPVFVLIRPRPGNFQYNEYEIEQMLEDIRISKELGADGLVYGALDKNNNVDFYTCQQLLAASFDLPVTFHRAFDVIADKKKALEDIIKLRFQRILSSGGSEKAVEGIQVLQELIEQANCRIIIMPGGDINDKNIHSILQTTRASEFHSSGRKMDPSSHTQKSKICNEEIVQNMRKILEQNIF